MDKREKATERPWQAVYFCKPDGSEIKTVSDVADALAFAANNGKRAELWGVTHSNGSPSVVCMTGNGDHSKANAALIVHSVNSLPVALKALEPFARLYEHNDGFEMKDEATFKVTYGALRKAFEALSTIKNTNPGENRK